MIFPEVVKVSRKILYGVMFAGAMLCACSAFEELSDSGGAAVKVGLNPYMGRMVTVDVSIAGETARLIFDTGGGETIINPDVARRIGCSPSGRSVAFRMSGERLDIQLCPDAKISIGGVAFGRQELGVWDISAVLPEGVPPVDGILSLKTIAAQPFTLDLATGTLILETATSYRDRIRDMSRLNTRLATGPDGGELSVFVRGKVDAPAWFLLDSGNLDLVQAAPYLGGSGDTWEHVLHVDGMPPLDASFRTRDIIYDGALSEAFMREWLFTFDLASNAVWVKRASSSNR